MTEELGSFGSWLRDATLGGGLMAAGAISVVFCVELGRRGVYPDDAVVIGTVIVFGAGIAALLSPALWLFARLTWRLGPLVAMASGPLTGAVAAYAMFVSVLFALDGHVPNLSPPQLALVIGLGPLSLGPPWVAYLAVRSRGRSALGVVLGAGLWSMVPMILLYATFHWIGWL